MPNTLVIRNAEVNGCPNVDVQIEHGVIVAIGSTLSSFSQEIDAAGGALIPGLIDHHIHLLAAAANADSLGLDHVETPAGIAQSLALHASSRPSMTWIRATGYHERGAPLISREELDQSVSSHPVRVQHQSGALWILNSLALHLVAQGETPPFVERDASGALTGRIWRGDAWLRRQMQDTPPSLVQLGRELAAVGVTGVMDTSASTDANAAAHIANAVRSGDLPQRVRLMSAGQLTAPDDLAFQVGPVKILLDDHDLPDFDEFVARIEQARLWGRSVAVHCVTEGELVLTLAALEAAGTRPGDRIEHGGIIAEESITDIMRLGLTVVTQPRFIYERGDRYLGTVEHAYHRHLYRCGTLLARGVPVAASSDAPYASIDPWAGMRAAIERRTRSGQPIAPEECVSPQAALSLYLGGFDRPGGRNRSVEVGALGDLCLLKVPLGIALENLACDLVQATIIGGRVVFDRSRR